jgi:hypothetical protein
MGQATSPAPGPHQRAGTRALTRRQHVPCPGEPNLPRPVEPPATRPCPSPKIKINHAADMAAANHPRRPANNLGLDCRLGR